MWKTASRSNICIPDPGYVSRARSGRACVVTASKRSQRKAAARKSAALHNKRAQKEDKMVDRIVHKLEEEDHGNNRKPSPLFDSIKPEHRASGRLDYVKVSNWDSLDKGGSVEDLKVETFSPETTDDDVQKPLYEQLVMQLSRLEASGELAVATSKPLPPFERWSFGRPEYLQYLADELAVHSALEAAVAKAIKSDGLPHALVAALKQLGPELGLFRAGAIRKDFALLAASTLEPAEGPSASSHAASYAHELRRLGRIASDPKYKGAARSSKAQCQLLAHAFVLLVTHLSTGTRIGAKATEMCNLFPTKAVHFYRTYPEHVKNPLGDFVQTVNALRGELEAAQVHQVMEELGPAMKSTSLLLTPIAVEQPKEQPKEA